MAYVDVNEFGEVRAMIDPATIQARRDALEKQLDQARAQYDQLEATLKELDRQLCGMAGGLHELDRLLAGDAAETIASNGALEDAIARE